MEPTQTVNAGNFVTFTLFPKLPPELRLKIWKMAASVPRAFIFRQDLISWDEGFKIKFRQKYPSVIRLNLEAREAQAAIIQDHNLSFAALGKGHIQFSPGKDIVFFQNFNFADLCFIHHAPDYPSLRNSLKLVENLALCGQTHLHLAPHHFELFFKLLPSLKSLVLYRSEFIREEQQMMMQQKGSVEPWMAKRGAHYLVQNQLEACWNALRINNSKFQAPIITFMKLRDIEALKSSPENWPGLR
jgi:hypothetical protein